MLSHLSSIGVPIVCVYFDFLFVVDLFYNRTTLLRTLKARLYDDIRVVTSNDVTAAGVHMTYDTYL